MYAPHLTIPHQVKCSTALTEIAEFCRHFVPDPSINFMWYSVFVVGRVGRVDEKLCICMQGQWDMVLYGE